MRIVFALLPSLLAVATVAHAQDAMIRALPVPTSTIYPGEVITADRLTERQFRTSRTSVIGVATGSAAIIGQEAHRRLAAGMPIALSALRAPLAIRRGTAALAFYRDDGFTISTTVVALADGSEGEVIDARALETGAVIKVEVLLGGELAVLGQ